MAKGLSRTRGGSGALARRQQFLTPTVVDQLQEIEQELGGRREIVGMLVLAPLTPDLRYLLGLLGDPRSATLSLAELCAQGNVLPGALLKHLGEAALLRGKVRASQAIGNGIAAVATDVMRRAAPYEAPCSTCLGTGSFTPEPTKDIPNPAPGPCDSCNGIGKLLYQPDLERQKLAIEMAQLLPKSGGIQIAQINAPGTGASGGGALERLSQLTDQILYGGGPEDEDPPAPVDAEITESPAAGTPVDDE